MTPELNYAKELVTQFIYSLSDETINTLYAEHKHNVNQRNINLVKEFRKYPHDAEKYFRHPASTLTMFKYEYLRYIIVNILITSTEADYFLDLTIPEITHILNLPVSSAIPYDIERTACRILRRPANKHVPSQLTSLITGSKLDPYTDASFTGPWS